MNEVKLYTNNKCVHCLIAKKYLMEKKINFKEIDINILTHSDISRLFEIGIMTLPTFIINGEIVSGFIRDKVDILIDNLL